MTVWWQTSYEELDRRLQATLGSRTVVVLSLHFAFARCEELHFAFAWSEGTGIVFPLGGKQDNWGVCLSVIIINIMSEASRLHLRVSGCACRLA